MKMKPMKPMKLRKTQTVRAVGIAGFGRRLFIGNAWVKIACAGMLVVAQGASAEPQKRAKQAVGSVMTQDPVFQESFVAFLREYHRAIAAGDRTVLAAHTQFPLSFGKATYDLEAKTQKEVVNSVERLLKEKDTLLWPTQLLPKTAADLLTVKRGQQKCSDAEAPEVPDFQKGEPAFSLRGNEVTFVYLANPCESETHMVTLRFVHSPKGWHLTERTARLGSK